MNDCRVCIGYNYSKKGEERKDDCNVKKDFGYCKIMFIVLVLEGTWTPCVLFIPTSSKE